METVESAERTERTSLTFDEVFDRIKNYGRYQAFFLLTIQYGCLISASNTLGGYMILGGLIPTYTCHDSDNINGTSFMYNKTNIRKNTTEACLRINACSNLTVDSLFYSMYQEFQWMCIPRHLLTTVASSSAILSPIGFLIGGHLSDHFGRKWLAFGEFAVIISIGFASCLSPSWQLYLAISVVNRAVHPLFYGSAFSLCMECIGSRWRLMQSFAFQWSLGYCVCSIMYSLSFHLSVVQYASLVAYLTKNWRVYYAVINTMGLPILVMFAILEESPRWLVRKRRYKQAAKAVNSIAKWNQQAADVHFTEEDMKMIEMTSGKTRHRLYNIGHLFSSKRLALYSVALISAGLCINTVASVILMNAQDLAGSPFLNYALMGVLRMWTPLATWLLERYSNWFGRKPLLVGAQSAVFLCFGVIIAIYMTGNWERWHIVATFCALFGFTLENGLVWVAYKTYTTELFPTVVRTIALNTFSLSSMAGSILAPQFIYLRNFWQPSPYAGAALISLMSIMTALFLLPETKGKSMPDTLEEASKSKRYNAKVHYINDTK